MSSSNGALSSLPGACAVTGSATSWRLSPKRLKALEAKSAQEHLVLTEAQVAALERARQEKEACGEIETEHPGYLESPRESRRQISLSQAAGADSSCWQ